jgi:predicted RNase H-like nuclease (RuvC/YqgF family)
MSFELTEFSGVGGALAGASVYHIVRLVFERRKVKAETKSVELDAETKAVELFERYASQMNPRIAELEVRVAQLSDEVVNLRIENMKLHMENESFRKENETLREQVETMHQEIENMRMALKQHEHRTSMRRGPQKPKQ